MITATACQFSLPPSSFLLHLYPPVASTKLSFDSRVPSERFSRFNISTTSMSRS